MTFEPGAPPPAPPAGLALSGHYTVDSQWLTVDAPTGTYAQYALSPDLSSLPTENTQGQLLARLWANGKQTINRPDSELMLSSTGTIERIQACDGPVLCLATLQADSTISLTNADGSITTLRSDDSITRTGANGVSRMLRADGTERCVDLLPDSNLETTTSPSPTTSKGASTPRVAASSTGTRGGNT